MQIRALLVVLLLAAATFPVANSGFLGKWFVSPFRTKSRTNMNVSEIRSTVEQSKPDDSNELSSLTIPSSEMNDAFSSAMSFVRKSRMDLEKAGWNLVSENEMFKLYRRKVPVINESSSKSSGNIVGGNNENNSHENATTIEYLMHGTVSDISPVSFLHAQVDGENRKRWDVYLKEMRSIGDNIMEFSRRALSGALNTVTSSTSTSTSQLTDMNSGSSSNSNKALSGGDSSSSRRDSDLMYCRVKWPWPFKDRDYMLSRRYKVFPSHNAIVFVSKSVKTDCVPELDDAVRVTSYRCHSAYVSCHSNNHDCSGVGASAGCDHSVNHSNNKKESNDCHSKHKNKVSSNMNSNSNSSVSQLLQPGFQFVTVYSENHVNNLPDVIVKFAENIVPKSINKVYEVAKDCHKKLISSK